MGDKYFHITETSAPSTDKGYSFYLQNWSTIVNLVDCFCDNFFDTAFTKSRLWNQIKFTDFDCGNYIFNISVS